MKRIVLVSPYFPPSGLTGVHRVRLFAAHLKESGWDPIVLTVKPECYKERLDYELEKILPNDLRIIRTRALKPNRLIGDVGIRCFFQHWVELRRLAKKREIDFVLICIPPNYSALLGRFIYEEFKIPFGIDYLDPWVMLAKTKERLFSKAWFSIRLARLLEPFAVKKASLIMGVAESYFAEVLERHKLQNKVVTVAIPYGFEKEDYLRLERAKKTLYLFKKGNEIFNFVYAGAMLPLGYSVLNIFLESLNELKIKNPAIFKKIKVHFIGTGKSPDDPKGFNIKPIAEQFGLYGTTIFEYPARIAYLDVLAHLKESDAIIIIGSTEKHYTPSKVFNAVFAKKPILALLRKESTAVRFLRESNACQPIIFGEKIDTSSVKSEVCRSLEQIVDSKFQEENVNYAYFDNFKIEELTERLSKSIDTAIKLNA